MCRGNAIDNIQDLHPERALSRAAFSILLTKHVLYHPDSKYLLKKKPVVAQATTTKRSAITYEQQWRWHTAVDSALSMLRERNT